MRLFISPYLVSSTAEAEGVGVIERASVTELFLLILLHYANSFYNSWRFGINAMVSLVLKETVGMLPTDNFEIMDDDRVVGYCQLRHKPSKSIDVPESFESHVYYEILPEERNKGYGKAALGLLIQRAQEIGLKELIIVIGEDNIFSQKVAEAHNAVLMDQRENPKGKKYLKYQITLGESLMHG